MKKHKKKKIKRKNYRKIKSTIQNFLKTEPNGIIVITGVTGSGKSSTALKLCQDLNGYIINADSRQVYKELKIGSAQPIPHKIIQNNKIPGYIWKINQINHFLYGHISIFKKYTLYNYQKEVNKILAYHNEKGSHQIPFLVGGTGMYINAVIKNYNLKKESFDPKQRKVLEKKSLEELQDMVPKKVLEKLNNSDRNNPYRLIRIIEKNGKLYDRGDPMAYLIIIIEPENKEIYNKRLNIRIESMFKKGLLKENIKIQELLNDRNLNKEDNIPAALNSIGYQEFNEYFDDKISVKDVKEKILLHTKQYSKRQRTWFRNKL